MALKEVIAIVRPEKALETEEALFKSGALFVSRHSVFGRGKEMGQQFFRSWFRLKSRSSSYLRKTKFSALVEEKELPQLIQALIKKNRSKTFGDGRIFVLPAAGD